MKKNMAITSVILTVLITQVIGNLTGFHYRVTSDGLISVKFIIEVALFFTVYIGVSFILKKLVHLTEKKK